MRVRRSRKIVVAVVMSLAMLGVSAAPGLAVGNVHSESNENGD